MWPDTLWKCVSGRQNTMYGITWGGREQRQNIFLLIIKRHLLGALDFRFCLIPGVVRPFWTSTEQEHFLFLLLSFLTRVAINPSDLA